MKKTIKSLLPKILVNVLRDKLRYARLKQSYIYDLKHYYKHSMYEKNVLESKLVSKIILDTHVIEKGLTMPETRFGFGKARLIVLIANLKKYITNYNHNEPQLLHGISVVDEYFLFHKNKGFDLSSGLIDKYLEMIKLLEINSIKVKPSQQIMTNRDNYFSNYNTSFFDFSKTRSSIRNYSEQEIDINKVIESIDLCRNTPSACNRQSVRIHLYTNKKEIEQILKIQGGNRGFGHLSSFLIIVTYEPSVYFEESERNSGYIDGGMYSMNILYALHANKLAACILNTAHNPTKDIKIREKTNIPASENFVAMIAGGIPPDEFMIAKSFRYPLDYILKKH
jgi:nitroreductase